MVKAVDIYHEWNLVYISLMVKNDSYLFKLDFWMLAKGKKMHLPIKECGSAVMWPCSSILCPKAGHLLGFIRLTMVLCFFTKTVGNQGTTIRNGFN